MSDDLSGDDAAWPRPLRPQDAMFCYLHTPRVPQHVGAIIATDSDPEANPGLRLEALLPAFERRLPQLPLLRRRLLHRSWYQRPAWVCQDAVELTAHVTEHALSTSGDHAEWAALLRDFFTAPLPRDDRPPWQLLLVHGGPAGASVVLAKMHHALGDGFAVLGTLIGLLADEDVARNVVVPDPVTRARRPDSLGEQKQQRRRRWQRYRKAATGLASLALAGPAPRLPSLVPPTSDPDAQQFSCLELSTTKVQQAARAHRVSTHTLLVGVVAEATHRCLAAYHKGEQGQGGRELPEIRTIRALTPRTARGALPPTGTPRAPGNYSAALQLDIPVGPMPAARRLAEIAEATKRLERRGQPAAAQVAMAAFGVLPAPAHAWVIRRIYGSRFFNLIVSVLPGPRHIPHMAGSPVRTVFPMLPLANGVGLGVCTLRWTDMIGVGVTSTPRTVPDAEEFVSLLRASFDDLQSAP